jgi:hypothetical protein
VCRRTRQQLGYIGHLHQQYPRINDEAKRGAGASPELTHACSHLVVDADMTCAMRFWSGAPCTEAAVARANATRVVNCIVSKGRSKVGRRVVQIFKMKAAQLRMSYNDPVLEYCKPARRQNDVKEKEGLWMKVKRNPRKGHGRILLYYLGDWQLCCAKRGSKTKSLMKSQSESRTVSGAYIIPK